MHRKRSNREVGLHEIAPDDGPQVAAHRAFERLAVQERLIDRGLSKRASAHGRGGPRNARFVVSIPFGNARWVQRVGLVRGWPRIEAQVAERDDRDQQQTEAPIREVFHASTERSVGSRIAMKASTASTAAGIKASSEPLALAIRMVAKKSVFICSP